MFLRRLGGRLRASPRHGRVAWLSGAELAAVRTREVEGHKCSPPARVPTTPKADPHPAPTPASPPQAPTSSPEPHATPRALPMLRNTSDLREVVDRVCRAFGIPASALASGSARLPAHLHPSKAVVVLNHLHRVFLAPQNLRHGHRASRASATALVLLLFRLLAPQLHALDVKGMSLALAAFASLPVPAPMGPLFAAAHDRLARLASHKRPQPEEQGFAVAPGQASVVVPASPVDLALLVKAYVKAASCHADVRALVTDSAVLPTLFAAIARAARTSPSSFDQHALAVAANAMSEAFVRGYNCEHGLDALGALGDVVVAGLAAHNKQQAWSLRPMAPRTVATIANACGRVGLNHPRLVAALCRSVRDQCKHHSPARPAKFNAQDVANVLNGLWRLRASTGRAAGDDGNGNDNDDGVGDVGGVDGGGGVEREALVLLSRVFADHVRCGKCDAHSVSCVVHAVHRLGVGDDALTSAVARWLVTQHDAHGMSLTPQQLANIANGLARQRCSDAEAWRVLKEQTVAMLAAGEPQAPRGRTARPAPLAQVASIANALCKAEQLRVVEASEDVFRVLGRAVQARLTPWAPLPGEPSVVMPVTVATLCHAFAKWASAPTEGTDSGACNGVGEDGLVVGEAAAPTPRLQVATDVLGHVLGAMEHTAARDSTLFRPVDLAMVTNALARTRMRNGPALRCISRLARAMPARAHAPGAQNTRACGEDRQWPAADAAVVLHGLAVLRAVRDAELVRHLVRVVDDLAVHSPGTFTAHDVACAAFGIAVLVRTGVGSGELVEADAQDACRVLGRLGDVLVGLTAEHPTAHGSVTLASVDMIARAFLQMEVGHTALEERLREISACLGASAALG